jgi:hypothetical protein
VAPDVVKLKNEVLRRPWYPDEDDSVSRRTPVERRLLPGWHDGTRWESCSATTFEPCRIRRIPCRQPSQRLCQSPERMSASERFDWNTTYIVDGIQCLLGHLDALIGHVVDLPNALFRGWGKLNRLRTRFGIPDI